MMNDTNLVQWTLERLFDNWRTETEGVPDVPILVNRDSAEPFEETLVDGHTVGSTTTGIDTDGPEQSIDLTSGNVISVATGNVSNQPTGGEFCYRVTAQIDVRIEAAHEDEWGHIAGDGEFKDLVREAKRALSLERNYPLPGEYHTLLLPDENPDLASHRDYYRHDITAEFRGYNELP